MRDIKFRAWHNKNKVMIEYAHIYDDFNQMIGSKSDLYSVMQFTGLKDKNGKEIYEGDIIEGKTILGQSTIRGQVVWDEGIAGWKVEEIHPEYNEREYLTEILKDKRHAAEVIGNIHEHKHLLK